MTFILASRISEMKPSASIAAKKKVTELQAAGHKIIDLTIGEPDLDTPPHIIDAAIQAMKNGETHYTATPGTPALRTAIANKLRRENGLDYQTENIVVGSGAKQIILTALEATLNPGDEVIIPAPYWVSYPDMVQLYGGKSVIVACTEKNDFKLTEKALEENITRKTRWLILNSPNNPTGAVYSRVELRALSDVLLRHPHVAILTDDIYEHIVFDGAEFLNIVQCEPRLTERTLVVNGMSKAYAMTGFRIGYGAGSRNLVNAIATILGQSTTCASSISQAAAVAALNGSQTFVHTSRDDYMARRDQMMDLLHAVPGISVTKPQGAFYLYPSVAGLIGSKMPSGSVLRNDRDVAAYLLEEAKVAVLDGAAYGLSHYLRLSFAASRSAIQAGCSQIGQAVEKLT